MTSTKPKRFALTISKIAIGLLLTAVMLFAAKEILNTQTQYQEAELLHQSLLVYKPISVTRLPAASKTQEEEPEPTEQEEPSAISLMQEQYPDVVGWLTLPGTPIDYPFVQGRDNDEYLRADLNGDYLFAGSIFLDYRSAPDFSTFNSIIYGHNMKNASMFGSLPNFKAAEYFQDITDGSVFLAEKEYKFEIFAALLTNNYDSILYNSLQITEEDKQAFLDYIRENARHYRNIGETTDDYILTLSTCSYEFDEARTVVVGRLIEIN